MKEYQEVLYGLYDDETDLIAAVQQAKDKHLDIFDVFSPFPVHGLDPVLGLEESRLHSAGFIYGALGTLTAFLGMTWIFTKDWPIVFGGKPYWSVPAFIPITFEFGTRQQFVGATVDQKNIEVPVVIGIDERTVMGFDFATICLRRVSNVVPSAILRLPPKLVAAVAAKICVRESVVVEITPKDSIDFCRR